MESVTSRQLRMNMGDVLNRVEYQNARVSIIRRGRPCAMIIPIAAEEVVSDPTAGITAAAGAPAPAAKKSQGKSPKNPRKP